MSLMVTKHFTAAEFDQRKWSGGPSVPYPAAWIPDRLKPLCESLEVIRAHFGKPIHVNSGFRSEVFNRAIGGARASQHVQGRACDIHIAGVSAAAIHEAVLGLSKAGKLPLIRGLGKYSTFVHLDTRQSPRLVRWTGSRDTN